MRASAVVILLCLLVGAAFLALRGRDGGEPAPARPESGEAREQAPAPAETEAEKIPVRGARSSPIRRFTGRVLDAGELIPIAHTKVRVYMGWNLQDHPERARLGLTVDADADGRYAFSLESGQQGFYEASAPGYGPARAAIGILASDPSEADEHDFRLIPGCYLAGRVVRDDLGPVDECEVWIAYAGGYSSRDILFVNHGPRPVRTRNGGAFTLPGTPPRRTFLIRAEAPDGAWGASRRIRLPTAAASRTDLVVRLRATGAITGRVVDFAGAPLRSTLWLQARQVFGDDDLDRELHTDPEGRFRADGLAPGRYRLLVVTERNPAGELFGPVTVRAGETTDLGEARAGGGFEVRGRVVPPADDADLDVADLRLVLYRDGRSIGWARTGEDGGFVFRDLEAGEYGFQVDSEHARAARQVALAAGTEGHLIPIVPASATVVLEVTDPSGEPIGDFDVAFADPGRPTAYSRENGVGEEGLYEAGPLPPGLYDVYVLASGRTPWEARGLRLEKGERREIPIVLHPAPVLRRQVMDADGRAVAGAKVWLTTTAGDEFYTPPEPPLIDTVVSEAATDAAGWFEATLDRGRLDLTVRAEGLAGVRHPFGTIPDGPIVLTPGVELRGRLVDEQGAPLGLVNLAAEPAGLVLSELRVETRADPDGRFVFRHLPPGRLDLHVLDHSGRTFRVVPVTAKPPVTDLGDLVLPVD